MRDKYGRFVKGNQDGRKFQKGYVGKPKGARNKKNRLAREFAEDVLLLDPLTAEILTYEQLCLWIKRKVDKSSFVLGKLLSLYGQK